MPRGPLLICYDGSDSARAAVEAASQLFHGQETLVLCCWQPFASSTKRFAVDILELVQKADDVNEREEQMANEIAEEGAGRAREGGLRAESRALRVTAAVDEAIVVFSDEIDASAIVLGARGRTSLRSLLIGYVPSQVVQLATRPVVIVPSPTLADRRRDGGVGDVHGA